MGLFAIIPQSHCVVVERMGKFSRIQHSGLRFILPFIERRKIFYGKEWTYNGENCAHKRFNSFSALELSDQRLNTNSRTYHTMDNVKVDIDAVIFWRIVDPQLAVYAVDNLILSLVDIALNALRTNIGSMTLDQVLSERASLTQNVTAELVSTSAKWGISLQKVEIQELNVDDQTQSAMLKQMDAERERRAVISIAEGEAEAIITVQSAIAEGIRKINEADPSKSYIAIKSLETMEKVSDGKATKIIIPSEIQSLAGLAASCKEFLKD